MSSYVPTFRDPTRLVSWLRFLLFANVVVCVAALVSDALQLQFLASAPYSRADADANDTRQLIVDVIIFVTFVATAITFCVWVYRANVNARQLGAQGMLFTPGWAVGWYFIPIAWLWKPYQAMVEIWKASKNPSAWRSDTGSSPLRVWWFCWLVSCIAGYLSTRLWWAATPTIDTLSTISKLNMAADAGQIGSALVLARLVRDISAMQMAHAVTNQF